MTSNEWIEQFPVQRFGNSKALDTSSLQSHSDDENYINVAREWDMDHKGNYIDKGNWLISLDHQCGEWEIGKPEQVRQMIRDLEEVIEYCEANP